MRITHAEAAAFRFIPLEFQMVTFMGSILFLLGFAVVLIAFVTKKTNKQKSIYQGIIFILIGIAIFYLMDIQHFLGIFPEWYYPHIEKFLRFK